MAVDSDKECDSNILSYATAKAGGLNPAFIVIPLLALGAILTAARIHGYSFSTWHAFIDGSPSAEVFLNEPKGYRSDDWVVALPHALSQCAVSPAFPVENPLVGDGHYNMIVSGPAPVRDVTALFRPQVWGYFISGDIGLAFQWWFGVLGLWIAVWLVLLRLTDNDRWTSAFAAAVLLFSPFTQAWSLNCAPSIIFACITLLAMLRLRQAVTFPGILSATALMAWCGTAFLMTFNYMPYLVTLLYFIIFVFVGAALQRQHPPPTAEHHSDSSGSFKPLKAIEGPRSIDPRSLRWIGFSLAALLILCFGAYLVLGNWEAIWTVQHSDYPGRRVSTGGDQTIWHVFRGNSLSLKPPPDWGNLNPCEGAAFFMVFPLVIAALLRDWWRTRQAPRAFFFWIAGYILFLLLWNFVGFPESLSRWTLLNRAPPSRTLIGLGLADLVLLAGYVASRRQPSPVLRADRFSPWLISALWIAFHMALAIQLSNYLPDYSLNTALVGGICAMALAPLLFLTPRLVLPVILAASIWATYDINPLACGGTEFIQNNPLSWKIMEANREEMKVDRRPVWIAYGDIVLPNLFRMLGVKALNGVHAYPQLDVWKKLDPEGRRRTVYNRYAHVVFDLPPTADEITFHLQQPDCFIVGLHPAHPRFADLGVDYILCLDHQTATFDRLPNLEKVYSFSGKHIYRVRQGHGTTES